MTALSTGGPPRCAVVRPLGARLAASSKPQPRGRPAYTGSVVALGVATRSGNVAAVSARPPRRSLVAGALGIAGTAITGCSITETGAPRGSSPLPGTPGRSHPDVELQLAAIAAERRLISGCQRALRVHPELAQTLRPIIADHTAHLSALGARRSVADRSPGIVPAAAPVALKRLARAEHAAADARVQDCVAASSRPFARLLASIGAAESQHAWALTEP